MSLQHSNPQFNQAGHIPPYGNSLRPDQQSSFTVRPESVLDGQLKTLSELLDRLTVTSSFIHGSIDRLVGPPPPSQLENNAPISFNEGNFSGRLANNLHLLESLVKGIENAGIRLGGAI